MDILQGLITGLKSPWDSRIRNILVDDHINISHGIPDVLHAWALATSVSEHVVTCNLGFLEPFVGVSLYDPVIEAKLNLPKGCQGIVLDSWFGFGNVKVLAKDPLHLQADVKSAIWTIPTFEKSLGLNVGHLFSGAFDGWGKAFRWLANRNIIRIDNTFAIDHDLSTIQMWAKQHGIEVSKGHISPSFQFSGEVFAGNYDVGCKVWYNISRWPTNVLWTKSPPCQSWSLGGRSQGLDSENGFSWIKSIADAKWQRPNAIIVECADAVPAHDHFKLVKACYKMIGYKLQWMGIFPLDDLTAMHRTRWIAIWLRNDVVQCEDPCTVRLADPLRLSWNDPIYKFCIPEFLMQQLKITHELAELYGNLKLLPSSKRLPLGDFASKDDVLNARCVKPDEVLPTLCSSYLSQHLLDHRHLSNKGIFAALVREHSSIRFFDPVMFLPLLGATKDQISIIDSDASVAFRHLGNAISVPHALLGILNVLKVCGFASHDILETIITCWNDRLTTNNAIVIVNGGLIFLTPGCFVSKILCDTIPVDTCEGIPVVFDGIRKHLTNMSCCEDLLVSCGIDKPSEQGISFCIPRGLIDGKTPLVSIAGWPVSCLFRGSEILLFSIPFESVFPTQPWTLQCEEIDDDSLLEVVIDAEIMLKSKSSIENRLTDMTNYGPMIGSDELTFVKNFVNVTSESFRMIEPWISGTSFQWVIREIQSHVAGNHFTVGCPIYARQHWGAFELQWEGGIWILNFINFDDRDFLPIRQFIQKSLLEHFPIEFVGNCVIPVNEGFCGWAIVNRWVKTCSIPFPASSNRICIDEIAEIVESSFETTADENFLVNIAKPIRLGFAYQLSKISGFPHHPIVFGAAEVTNDVNMSASSEQKVDPWLRYDPWQGGKRQCRWEDLTLPGDHPFHDTKGNRIQQIHRHALAPTNPGIAFCAKGAVGDAIAKNPKQPFAFIIPANDKVVFDSALGLKISPMHEIVVEDSVLGTIYKRQIIFAQTQDQVVFSLPKPEYKATLTEKFEIVLEAFTCLLSKESFTHFADKPFDTLKARIGEQCPSIAAQHANLYGFRRIPDKCHKDHYIIQAMCRVTKEARAKLLEISGTGDIFIRNFVPKEGEKSDLTVIPKFWPSDRAGRDESLRAAGSLDGFAGIIATRRGIAVRCWCEKVANLRKVLLSCDDRINEINVSMIPVERYDSTGWPANISPGEIVKAVHYSCKLPSIPTRCFRANGVTTWTLGFEQIPAVLKFTASFNGITCEILLTKAGDPKKKIVGKAKFQKKPPPNTDAAKPVVSAASEETNSRITALETKFASMERRQDSMEQRLQSNFDGIQSQLRQVLNAVQPRAASPSPTGYTPPPKMQKPSI